MGSKNYGVVWGGRHPAGRRGVLSPRSPLPGGGNSPLRSPPSVAPLHAQSMCNRFPDFGSRDAPFGAVLAPRPAAPDVAAAKAARNVLHECDPHAATLRPCFAAPAFRGAGPRCKNLLSTFYGPWQSRPGWTAQQQRHRLRQRRRRSDQRWRRLRSRLRLWLHTCEGARYSG